MKRISLETLNEANRLKDPQDLLDLIQEKNDKIQHLIELINKSHVGNGYFVSVKGKSAPTFIHKTYADAKKEAIRLAKLVPDTKVTISSVLDSLQATFTVTIKEI